MTTRRLPDERNGVLRLKTPGLHRVAPKLPGQKLADKPFVVIDGRLRQSPVVQQKMAVPIRQLLHGVL